MVESGVVFDITDKQKWGRDIMVTHHSDLKTTIEFRCLFLFYQINLFIKIL